MYALSVDSEKKSPLKHGQYYRKIGVRTLLAARAIEEQKGPYIGLKEFFAEYRNLNPDLTSIQLEDMEKSLSLLQKDGWISGVEREPDGNKIVIFKLDDRKALEIVDKDVKLQKGGVTAEELALLNGWSVDYSRRVLCNMEKTETSKRVIGDDSITRWYFPSKFSVSRRRTGNSRGLNPTLQVTLLKQFPLMINTSISRLPYVPVQKKSGQLGTQSDAFRLS